MKLTRQPTITSPTTHIRSYSFRPFLSLMLAGFLLSFLAGYINAISLMSSVQIPISAMTGMTSRMMTGLANGNFPKMIHFFLLIFCFVLGNFLSGALVGGSSFRIQRSYGIVLLIASAALALGTLFEVFPPIDTFPIDRIVLFLENSHQTLWNNNCISNRCIFSLISLWFTKWNVYDIFRCCYSYDTCHGNSHGYWISIRSSGISSSNSKTSLEIENLMSIVHGVCLRRFNRLVCISNLSCSSIDLPLFTLGDIGYCSSMLLQKNFEITN